MLSKIVFYNNYINSRKKIYHLYTIIKNNDLIRLLFRKDIVYNVIYSNPRKYYSYYRYLQEDYDSSTVAKSNSNKIIIYIIVHPKKMFVFIHN